jgi:hypothetical protein
VGGSPAEGSYRSTSRSEVGEARCAYAVCQAGAQRDDSPTIVHNFGGGLDQSNDTSHVRVHLIADCVIIDILVVNLTFHAVHSVGHEHIEATEGRYNGAREL